MTVPFPGQVGDTDIVARLRNEDAGEWHYRPDVDLMRVAADEIDRLRADLEASDAAAELLMRRGGVSSPVLPTREALLETVRGSAYRDDFEDMCSDVADAVLALLKEQNNG